MCTIKKEEDFLPIETTVNLPIKSENFLECDVEIKTEIVDCNECDFQTNEESNLKQHVSLKHIPNQGIKYHSCHLCKYISKRKTTLKLHLDRVHYQKEKKFKCDQCSYITHMKLNLKKHILTMHIGTHLYKCKICKHKAISKALIKKHTQDVHSIITANRLHCDQCPYTSDKNIELEAHKISKHLPKELIQWINCEQCDYKTISRRYLTTHIKRMHSSTDKKDKKDVLCDKCSFVTNSIRSLNRHKIIRHGPPSEIKWYYCSTCDYKSKSSSGLKRHFYIHHSNIDRKFYCDKCPFGAIKKQTVLKHSEAHSVGEWLDCDECDYKSQIRYDFDEHVTTLHCLGKFRCSHCKYSAESMNSIKGHMRKMHSKKQLKKSETESNWMPKNDTN